ncbi:aminotransferase class V-fold PLP-dependent enzyme [Paraburkholderia phenazinium]|uniref:Cysteine desulfurase n=1 Tax=Paraburkholderia phenazinium TaxID=60549 RepID=A0A1G8M2W7_9BURK|nr:cysteine desulfurase [Paraburkholderia phenazinium]SDI62235.1 cysteine desulfurase [Paraburkholderia phenazinium]
MSLHQAKKDFPIFTHDEGLIYLDNAATTQKPASVIDAMTHYYSHINANVGRSVHKLSNRSHEAYEASRQTLGQFVNAASSNSIVFTKGTTEAINFVAQNFAKRCLKPGDEVVVTGMEHHSNLLPWQTACEEAGATLRVVPVDATGRIRLEDYQALLSPQTRLVAIAHVSNVLGVTNPVKEMARLARERDIPVLIDGAQAIAHLKVDVQDLDVDFYCFSGHKMYGPQGIGVLYIHPRQTEWLAPFQTGGGVAYGVNYERVTHYLPAPHRFEAGTPNVAGAVGLARAASYLAAFGLDAVQQHDQELFFHAVKQLGGLPGVQLFGAPGEPGSILSFGIRDLHPYDVGNHLNNFDIAVRTGVHCAIPLVDSLGVLGTVRMSFSVYNTPADIDKVAEALVSVKPGQWTKEHPTSRFLH